MLDANDLVTMIKKAAVDAVNAAQPAGVVFGKVVSVSPIQILVEQKMTLGEAQLVLTRSVMNYKTMVTAGTDSPDESGQSDQDGQKEVNIHNGLAAGDQVILLRQQGGQKYIVLDRAAT